MQKQAESRADCSNAFREIINECTVAGQLSFLRQNKSLSHSESRQVTRVASSVQRARTSTSKRWPQGNGEAGNKFFERNVQVRRRPARRRRKRQVMGIERAVALLVLLTIPEGTVAGGGKNGTVTAQKVLAELTKTFGRAATSSGIDVDAERYGPPEIPAAPDEFDFIIVGAGSAGSVLINRLSNVTGWKVLVLEAGGVPDFMSDIPMFALYQQFTPRNWAFATETEDHLALGLEDRKINWPRGKVLGGSSVLNYMVYTRGNRVDYDRWAAMGNDGWSYDDVLPLFKKFEDARLGRSDARFRGKGGEVSVEDVAFRTKSALAFVAAAQELGYNYIDVNGANMVGVEFIQATTSHGLRCSGEKAFIRPAKLRKNLTIRVDCHVTKILIDGHTKQANGVEYVHHGKTYRATATKEVILSAGVINSPQLLMLSGIGPKGHLESLGIRVVKNLPVGRKLYDHQMFTGLTFALNQSVGYDMVDATNPRSYVELRRQGGGPLQVLGGIEAVAFVRTNASNDPHPTYPDIEMLFFSLHVHSDGGVGLKRMLRLSDDLYDKVYRPLEGTPAYGIFPIILHPKSHGRLELRSRDPFAHPKIYAGYLSDDNGSDVRTLVAGIREARRLAETAALRRYGSHLVTTPIPGCGEPIAFDSDEYWECAARRILGTTYHHTTTCKMGPPGDPEAVVDPRLKVHGVKRLRVVDTSVIPLQLSAHTNVPAFMVGEKAAALIKEDWLGR